MLCLAVGVERRHGEDELVPQPGQADPAGVDVVGGEAGQLHPRRVVREEVAVAVIRGVPHSRAAETSLHLAHGVRGRELKRVTEFFQMQ